jgi:gamma-glutamylcyclotransferase
MHYFAYASNLNRRQMRERCQESKPLFVATLPNYKLVFAGWSRQWRGGMASIKLHHGEKVIGGVYEVTEQDLRKLDRYEGCPGVYNRLKVIVFDEDGNQVEAVTYIKSGQLDETPPTKEYVAVIQQGYKDWEIDR